MVRVSGYDRSERITLWKAEELIAHNHGYKVAEFFPNFFFIGSGQSARLFCVSWE
jgi:hypothetical protein